MTKQSALKWTIRLAIWIWFGYWVAQIFVGDLGASPALKLNHEFGFIALVLLTANLVLGAALDILQPAPKWLRMFNSERRFWGVSSFLVLCAHVGFYFVNEAFEPKAWTQLYTKTYLIFASLSFLILAALAVTSNDFSVRKLGGKRWKALHRTVYIAQFLLFGHILLIEKADLQLFAPWLLSLALLQVGRFAVRRVRKARKK